MITFRLALFEDNQVFVRLFASFQVCILNFTVRTIFINLMRQQMIFGQSLRTVDHRASRF